MREGMYRAIVTANNDPLGEGRVRMRVPSVFGPEITGWATPLLGRPERNPDVGARVWASFEAGDLSHPLYLHEPEGGPPIGSMSMFAGAASPAGWLLCDGTAVSRADYPELFAVIGTTFGAGDGATTFTLPDLRQRFPLGKAAAGTGATLGGTGGAIDHGHGVSTNAVPGHTHSVSGSASASASTTPIAVGTGDTVAASGHTHAVSGSAGTDGAHDHSVNQSTANPPFIALNFIIKA